MRIRDIDPGRWAQISDEINALCDEIVEDDGVSNPTWTSELVPARIYEDLNRAALLAMLHAASPSATMGEMKSAAGISVSFVKEPR